MVPPGATDADGQRDQARTASLDGPARRSLDGPANACRMWGTRAAGQARGHRGRCTARPPVGAEHRSPTRDPECGDYHVRDVKFVAAFDVDAKKVGFDLADAIGCSRWQFPTHLD